MSSDASVSLCGRVDCPVCTIRQRLVGAGAVEFAPSTLFDDDTPGEARCEVTICDSEDCDCQTRLKIDIDQAPYRFKDQQSEQSKMCDFAVIATVAGEHVAAAIELKLGAATWEQHGPQLREGLTLLHEEFGWAGAQSVPRAYLVVGKERDMMQTYLDAASIRLRYGSQEVLVEVIDCGSCIDLSA